MDLHGKSIKTWKHNTEGLTKFALKKKSNEKQLAKVITRSPEALEKTTAVIGKDVVLQWFVSIYQFLNFVGVTHPAEGYSWTQIRPVQDPRIDCRPAAETSRTRLVT